MFFVKFQPLPERFEARHLLGGGQIQRILGAGLRTGEIAQFRAGHAHRIEDQRLGVAGEIVGFGCKQEGGPAVARRGVFVRGEDMRGVGEDLKIAGLQPYRGAQFVQGVSIAA